MQDAPNYNADVIRPIDRPLAASGGIAVLRGNLAPDGAVLKPSAASPHLMRHRGRAVVFESIEHYNARIDDPDLDVDADCVLVLKGCGPKGYPGMAEVGNMGLPPKVLQTGVTDMVRISDARMSGTAYGTAVLHVSPEAAAGGPLALVRDGDMIELDVEARRLHVDVSDAELARAACRLAGAGAGRAARRVRAAVHRARAAGRQGGRPGFSRRLPRTRRRAGIALKRRLRAAQLRAARAWPQLIADERSLQGSIRQG